MESTCYSMVRIQDAQPLANSKETYDISVMSTNDLQTLSIRSYQRHRCNAVGGSDCGAYHLVTSHQKGTCGIAITIDSTQAFR